MSPSPVRWESAEVSFSMGTGQPEYLSSETAHSALALALNAWGSPECSAITLSTGADVPSVVDGWDDGVNGIYWVSTGWDARGFPVNAPARTEVRYESVGGNWRIVEADIYINAASYVWTGTSGETTSSVRSLRAVITHEIGHALGLLHPCDDDGAASCAELSGAMATTMYPYYTGPDQAVLSPDDTDGICYLYPVATCGCASVEVCLMGNCVSCENFPSACQMGGPDPDGASCMSDSSCQSGMCTDGRCMRSCQTDPCDFGFACEDDVCIPTRGDFGDDCEQGEECHSALCLVTEHPRQSACTRICHVNAPCPGGYLCDEVDDARVCVPQASSGCTTHGAGSDSWWSWFLFICVVIGVRRWRK